MTYNYGIRKYNEANDEGEFMKFDEPVGKYYLMYYNATQDLAFQLSENDEDYSYQIYNMGTFAPDYLGEFYNGCWFDGYDEEF